ncbi:MAG: perosamine synthetase, partial [Thermoproteota archaeon]|nr:perosamine synthetase [Thermoproteota archaeon]
MGKFVNPSRKEEFKMEKMAIDGGKPVARSKIPIAKPMISEETLGGISEVLRSGYLSQGSRTAQFEEEFKKKVGANY